MSDPYLVRVAEPSEARAAANVLISSRRDAGLAIPPPAHTDDEVRRWFIDHLMPTSTVWVAEFDAAIVAVMVLRDSWLDQLYVASDHVGKGVGTQLLTEAKRQRPRGLDLWTFQSNAGAQRFYERHGFIEVDRTDGDNEEGAPDIMYHWGAG